jgi:hypothetical protein
MGYYTQHSVQADDRLTHISSIEKKYDFMQGVKTKWYHRQEDMRAYSKWYPMTLFKVTGDGEDHGDFWVEYYKDGKMQRCPGKITYDPYDEDLLG